MASTTRLSSKGQIVIPAALRRALRWQPGDALTVELQPADGEALVLRRQTPDDVEALISRGYAWLERQRVSPVDILHESRQKARARERRRR